MTDTVIASPLDRLPPELLRALYAHPDDFALRSAIADELLALGEVEASACLMWSVEKRRIPINEVWYHSSDTAGLPYQLIDKHHPEEIDHLVWHRVVYRWLNSTPEQIASYWEWTP